MKIEKLIVKNLYKSFEQAGKELNVIKGVNFDFERGKTYSIIGASGSGKSTLLHLLGGLDVPCDGVVLCNDHNIFTMNQKTKEKFLNKHLGFVFQFHYLIKELSVIENIILPGLIASKSKKECIQKAEKLLKELGLEDKMYSYPTQLSGGQLQRIAILRAIFNEPDFLLADEPTGDLDAQNAQLIIDLLLNCQKKWGMGLIICSHDKSVYERMEKVLTLYNGILRWVKI